MSAAPITKAYEDLLETGRILPDAAQADAAAKLGEIQRVWSQPQEKPRLLKRVFRKGGAMPGAVRGIYLWGEVGRGKSLLMDQFYATAAIQPKRRAHYHAFMLDIHARIHAWRSAHSATSGDPVPHIAGQLAKEARLLCLDELQVTDIADAMILARLFSTLMDLGVKVVFTSNRKPDALYLHGLQRDRFLPFIALIHRDMAVMELASAEDYRLKQLKAMQDVYLATTPEQGRKWLDAVFARLTQGAPLQQAELDVQGRRLPVSAFHGDVARFTFAELCALPLGAADYEAIAQNFTTVLLESIPRLSPEKRNEAKRFVTLIDTLYEHKVKLVCTAEVPPQSLYPAGDGSFEFARTVSRLMEMQSESYLAASHKTA